MENKKPFPENKEGRAFFEGRIMGEGDIRRIITRLAHEILEKHKDTKDLILIGIHTRGVPLSRRISRAIREIRGIDIPTGSLDISFYRNDISRKEHPPPTHPTEIPFDLTDKEVILVDDVLYTGRSIRAAMDALMDYGRPKRIELLVLIDRGHREIPIRADYVGKNIPSSYRDEVRVLLKEVDGRDEVLILRGKDEG